MMEDVVRAQLTCRADATAANAAPTTKAKSGITLVSRAPAPALALLALESVIRRRPMALAVTQKPHRPPTMASPQCLPHERFIHADRKCQAAAAPRHSRGPDHGGHPGFSKSKVGKD
jgi:hypothetical protein